MSWNKIENHLFEKYYVEGEDKKLCKLMEAHDKEIQDKAIDTFAEEIKCTLPIAVHRDCSEVDYEVDRALYALRNQIDRIAEQMKEVGE